MSHPVIIIDAGPLVALLVRSETHHVQVRQRADRLDVQLYTCCTMLAKAAQNEGEHRTHARVPDFDKTLTPAL